MKLRFLVVALAIAAASLIGCGKKTPETNGNAIGAAEQTQTAAAETQPSPAEAQSAELAAPTRSQAQQAQPEAPRATPPAQEQKEEKQKDNTQDPPR